VPIAQAKKSGGGAAGFQDELDFDVTGERRQANPLINDLRTAVDLWRTRGYPHVTPVTRNLLLYWADQARDNRVLFCQRESAETAIYLAEASGRDGFSADWRRRMKEANEDYNAGLPRHALKMATGTGKTVVMAMLIAWQTINKVTSPRDPRFAKRFLVVTPSITIRDRLRVLAPGAPGNYLGAALLKWRRGWCGRACGWGAGNAVLSPGSGLEPVVEEGFAVGVEPCGRLEFPQPVAAELGLPAGRPVPGRLDQPVMRRA
jgi:hypothetical protein